MRGRRTRALRRGCRGTSNSSMERAPHPPRQDAPPNAGTLPYPFGCNILLAFDLAGRGIEQQCHEEAASAVFLHPRTAGALPAPNVRRRSMVGTSRYALATAA